MSVSSTSTREGDWNSWNRVGGAEQTRAENKQQDNVGDATPAGDSHAVGAN